MKISETAFNSQTWHEYTVEMAIFNVQREITQKVENPELWFVCSALLNIYVKFHENVVFSS